MTTELTIPKLEKQATTFVLPVEPESTLLSSISPSMTSGTGTVSIGVISNIPNTTGSTGATSGTGTNASPQYDSIISKIVAALQEEMATLHLDNTTILTYIIKVVQLVNGETTISPDDKKKIILEIIDDLIDLTPLDPLAKSLLKELVVLLYPAINGMIDHLASGALVLVKKVIVLAEDGIEEIEDDSETWCEKYCSPLVNQCCIG
jgi:hypothetical protein